MRAMACLKGALVFAETELPPRAGVKTVRDGRQLIVSHQG
jgi:hypothetical protein